MEGRTTFYSVTDGIESALEQARAVVPPDKDILIGGGANVINQCLNAGLVDEFWLRIAPVLVGAGARVLDGVNVQIEPVRVVDGGEVTHLKYRMVK